MIILFWIHVPSDNTTKHRIDTVRLNPESDWPGDRHKLSVTRGSEKYAKYLNEIWLLGS